MNQTKKRLSIINLAISITDIETIQLQILKLGPLRSDSKIQEILSMLQAESYAQAQGLITTYIESSTDEILQRTAQKKEERQKIKEKAVIREFDLFIEDEDENEPDKEINNLDTFVDPIVEPKKLTTEQINYDALLNVDADDILPDNIELDISHTPQDTFFDTETNTAESIFAQKSQDTFFDQEDNTVTKTPKEERFPLETKKDEDTESTTEPLHYKPISYIKEKFQNIVKQYPPIEKSEALFSSVDTLLEKITHHNYTEKVIEKTLKEIDELSSENKAEAAELLLLIASTESKYAKFQLARALFKGELLQKNVPEAFTLINRLAVNDDYPEAICDLGQFYEYGIGIDKDISKARLLYQEAMEMGINRASEHYKRISSKERSFFSFFKK